MCLHWEMFISEKAGIEKCAFHKERLVILLGFAENVSLLLQVRSKLFLLHMWICRKFWGSWAVELRFLLRSADLLDFLRQALKHFQDLETGLQWEINYSVHILSIRQLYSHFSAVFYLIFYWLTDYHCCFFHPPHDKVPHVFMECCGTIDIKTSIVWSWEN